ncbi:hypothetical protein CFOL_v3_07121 [Cephalotus follicularis]|uniref:Uncharacterized protein n=1 Tax=Cephalotus follicularis TaxID=3775 RepID=A0A1Q3B749_CEPFO|nr:hypothetical protein CFOL_v3_07121 [Cephalotus follicularis]
MDSSSNPKKHQQQHHQPSSSELLQSAKLVAEAARSTFSHETDKVDKAKIAGAAENLLGAAAHYGKLEDGRFGKYIDQAENYLHQYHSSHSTTTTTQSGHATTTNHSGHSTTTNTTHYSTHSSGGGDGQSDSGSEYGDYFKMAQGFLKKH